MPLRVGVVQARSYDGTKRGALTINADMMPDISGRDVLVIDDIFDTGNTLHEVQQLIHQLGPNSLQSAVLLLQTRIANRSIGNLILSLSKFRMNLWLVMDWTTMTNTAIYPTSPASNLNCLPTLFMILGTVTINFSTFALNFRHALIPRFSIRQMLLAMVVLAIFSTCLSSAVRGQLDRVWIVGRFWIVNYSGDDCWRRILAASLLTIIIKRERSGPGKKIKRRMFRD